MGLKSTISKIVRDFILCLVVLFALDFIMNYLGKNFVPLIADYRKYVIALILLVFGVKIISNLVNLIYEIFLVKYREEEAKQIKNAIYLFLVGIFITVFIGSLINPSAALAAGGFLGMVVGFATQNILNQVVSGFFLIVAKPFKIGEKVKIKGVEGYIEEIGILYTKIKKDDGKFVLIPNNQIINNVIEKYGSKQ